MDRTIVVIREIDGQARRSIAERIGALVLFNDDPIQTKRKHRFGLAEL